MQAAAMMRVRWDIVKDPPRRKAVVRALVKERAEPGLWMADVPMPVIGEHDALVRVRRTSICGTDLHIWGWDRWSAQMVHVPMVIGHECMGEVAGLGGDAAGLRIGQRVAVEGHVPCGSCRNCRAGRRHLCHKVTSIGVDRDGCFAEYVAVPAANLFPIPDQVPDDVASLLDPLGNAVHSALSFDLVGEDVLVTGAGPIGIMAAAIARFVGARHVVITDVSVYRLELARRMGVTRAVDVRATTIAATMTELGMTEGFDVGMEMSGSGDGFRSLIGAMNHGGRIALLGLPGADVPLDLTQVIVKGLTIKGIYGRELFETWYKMAALLRGGLDIAPIVTHRFAAARFADAFDVTRSGLSGKVVLDWDA